MNTIRVAVLPKSHPEYEDAIAAGGGVFSVLDSHTNGLVWTDSQDVSSLADLLESHPQVSWVQLPFAGVDNFKSIFDSMLATGRDIRFTSAKGAYREPVAEHALMLALALARILPERLAAKSWGRKFAATIYDSHVLIVGGGGIAEELIRLLTPFRPAISVIRRQIQSMDGVAKVSSLEELDELLPTADFVFSTSALTEETQGLFNLARFELMKSSSYFVNIARGAIVSTSALEQALSAGLIAGAGIDVTDPEPLPDGHSLWSAPNLIITPHTADTPEMCISLLSERIVENVAHLSNDEALNGLVNLNLGY
jgi:phosphoglycerate dehydrogenase-like enzyme